MTDTNSRNTDPANRTLENAAAFRSDLKDLSVEFLSDDDLDRAQEVMQILRRVKRIEAELQDIVSGASPLTKQLNQVVDVTQRQFGKRDLRTKDPNAYPRFLRRGDTLIRVALKRDKTTEYEQKLSRSRFEDIRDALLLHAQEKPEFEVQDIADMTGIPSYVVYLLIGLLQEQGLVVNPSKGSYRLRKAASHSAINDVWNQVPVEEDN